MEQRTAEDAGIMSYIIHIYIIWARQQ